MELPFPVAHISGGASVTAALGPTEPKCLPACDRGVGVIFQSYALFPRTTVEQNVSYGLKIRRRRRSEIKETVDQLLSLVRLEEHRNKPPSQLSGGQHQGAAIARTPALPSGGVGNS